MTEDTTILTSLDRLCRTCLSEKTPDELKSLYDGTLRLELREITSIEIQENDGLPYGICNNCCYALNIALNFKSQCQKSEHHLKSVLFPVDATIIYKSITILDNNNSEDLCLEIYDEQSIVKTENNVEICTAEELVDNQLNLNTSKIESLPPIAQDTVEIKKLNYEENKNRNIESEEVKEVCDNQKENKKLTVIKYNPRSINKEKDDGKVFDCLDCGKKFRFESSYKSHMVMHGKKLVCEVCQQVFNVMKTYKSHLLFKHPDYRPHKCKHCGKGFNVPYTLMKHMRIHGGEKKHLCTVCGKSFYEHNHLLVHSRTHTGEKPLPCLTCGKTFSNRHGLNTHNKIHTGERKYQCIECGKRFAHSFVLSAHKRTHTGEKPYKCSICEASFASSSYLKIHKRIHTREKPYTCDICSKTFVSKSGLSTHKVVHSKERHYQCSICGKTLSRPTDLQVHIRSHTGEKPYACDMCHKRYITSSNLSAHKRTHLGIKDYVCSTCGKAFGDPRTLKCHYRTHTGERPYQCTVCGNSYSQSGQLSVHKRIHDNVKKEDMEIVITFGKDINSYDTQK